MNYRKQISEILGGLGERDARRVEAFMRTARPTLDALSPAEFAREARLGAACALEAGADADDLADALGLP